MIKSLSRYSGYGYRYAVKPVLFLLPPDNVHNSFVSVGATFGRIAPMKGLFKALWRYDNEPKLAQVINGIYFANPVGLSAGFDKNFKLPRILPYIGFGLAEGGTVTRYACEGNPRPHYHRLKKSKSILVHAGLNNIGVDAEIIRLKNHLKARKLWMPINISVGYTNIAKNADMNTAIADYVYSVKKIKKAKVGEIITLNVSCPNVYGGEPFTTPDRLNKLLTEIDKIDVHQPIYLKMPSDKSWPEFKKLIDVALKHNVSGITLTNLAKDRKTTLLLDEISDNIPGNMSGRPTYKLSNDLIHQSYAYCGNKLTIIGVGGIFSAKEAYEKIKHGATLVELITGMLFEGPQLIGQINAGIVELMEKDGYTHISQAIGAYHRKTKR